GADFPEHGHAVHRLHHQIDESDIVLCIAKCCQCIQWIVKSGNLKSACMEGNRDGFQNVRLVINDENSAGIAHSAGTCAIGRRTENTVPFPTSDSTQILPLYISTISFAIANPRPTLPGVVSTERLICTNLSKILSRYSGGIPSPVSRTASKMLDSSARVVML